MTALTADGRAFHVRAADTGNAGTNKYNQRQEIGGAKASSSIHITDQLWRLGDVFDVFFKSVASILLESYSYMRYDTIR